MKVPLTQNEENGYATCQRIDLPLSETIVGFKPVKVTIRNNSNSLTR